MDWKRLGVEGRSHGFLIVALSPAIAYARPCPDLYRMALMLCNLYLGRAVAAGGFWRFSFSGGRAHRNLRNRRQATCKAWAETG